MTLKMTIITNITRKYNEAAFRCEVYNDIGKSADTKTLEVAYVPTFVTKPQNVEGELGSTATLSCIVDGYPTPRILWMRYKNDRVILVGKSSNLTITITKETAGQYWCRASVGHYQDLRASATVYVKGPPKIVSNETQYGVEGHSVKVYCISFSNPKPDYIKWTFAGDEINTFHNQEYEFLEETLTDSMTISTLLITKSYEKHYGKYNCTVINAYGMDSTEINLVADNTLQLLLIISICATFIILVLIIMLIIMLYNRRRGIRKNSMDQFKDNDRNSNISDLKIELRQVEGSFDLDNSNIDSEIDIHPTLHLTSNLGLPLAGPVPLPDNGYDNELMKQYQRYSAEFNQPINNLHSKIQGQSHGYVPYVDYTRDYAPPLRSQTGSSSRSTDGSIQLSQYGSLSRQASCGRLGGKLGPDIIPMPNSSVVLSGGVDVRYSATYRNPYLRGSGSLSYVQQVNANPSAKSASPLYNSARNQNIHPNVAVPSPSTSSSSRYVTSPLASSSSTVSSAQPQVSKPSSLSSGALYILPKSSHGSLLANQITVKETIVLHGLFGFRPKHSCPQQVHRIVEYISSGFYPKREKTVVVFFDVAKAFDKIWLAGLVYKLYKLDVPVRIVHIVGFFLQHRFSSSGTKHLRTLSDRFFKAANPLVGMAIVYEPPLPSRCQFRRPRSVMADPPNQLSIDFDPPGGPCADLHTHAHK
ncbi:uncharacterized protein ACR2FA_002306 [Aphomia sociella]